MHRLKLNDLTKVELQDFARTINKRVAVQKITSSSRADLINQLMKLHKKHNIFKSINIPITEGRTKTKKKIAKDKLPKITITEDKMKPDRHVFRTVGDKIVLDKIEIIKKSQMKEQKRMNHIFDLIKTTDQHIRDMQK